MAINFRWERNKVWGDDRGDIAGAFSGRVSWLSKPNGSADHLSSAIASRQLLVENAILFPNIVDDFLLVLIHPSPSNNTRNPDELSKLLDIKNIRVRTRNDFHAKVVITSTLLIVGSANASANGLGQEGEEANNLEAAVMTNNQGCIEKTRV